MKKKETKTISLEASNIEKFQAAADADRVARGNFSRWVEEACEERLEKDKKEKEESEPKKRKAKRPSHRAPGARRNNEAHGAN